MSKTTAEDEPIQSSPEERAALSAIARELEAFPGIALLVDGGGAQLALPAALRTALLRAAVALADGNDVVVLPVEGEMTTQEAADFLGVSRPHLVDLTDRGEIAHRLVGTHRRLRIRDVLAYRHSRDVARRADLAALLGGANIGAGPILPLQSRAIAIPFPVEDDVWTAAMEDPRYVLVRGEIDRPAMCRIENGRARFVARTAIGDEECVHDLDDNADLENAAWRALADALTHSAWGQAGDLTLEGAVDRSASCFIVHDLLACDGRSIGNLPYGERRRMLEARISGFGPFPAPAWQTSTIVPRDRYAEVLRGTPTLSIGLRRLDAAWRSASPAGWAWIRRARW